jgi:hypothetical protein
VVAGNAMVEPKAQYAGLMGTKKSADLRMIVGASAGGHMNQMLRLLENGANWPVPPHCLITTQPEVISSLSRYGTVEVLGKCNHRHPVKSILVGIHALRLVLKHRPQVVVTTGSLPLALVCLWAKLGGARIVWIDSIANIYRFSMSGRLVYLFADLFLTQWPDLAQRFSKAEYAGELL